MQLQNLTKSIKIKKKQKKTNPCTTRGEREEEFRAKPYSCKLVWKKIIEKQPEKEIYSCTKRN